MAAGCNEHPSHTRTAICYRKLPHQHSSTAKAAALPPYPRYRPIMIIPPEPPSKRCEEDNEKTGRQQQQHQHPGA